MAARPGALPDPKLLLLFEALYRTHSVTAAAASLGQEQPTVSIWLGKLRERFGDPLFVRTSAGMQPTPRAQALVAPIRAALEQLRGIPGQAPEFDASTTKRRFSIAATDATHFTMLPRLLSRVRQRAPAVAIGVYPIDADLAASLESGAIDLALGFLPSLKTGFYQQALFMQDYVCLVNARHPRVRGSITLAQLAAEAHVATRPTGTGHDAVDRAFERQRIERRVLLELPGFLGLGRNVATTDLVAVLPRQIGETLAKDKALRMLECPLKIPTYLVRQHWHARYHHEAGNRWLRVTCAELFGGAVAARGTAKGAGR